MELGFDELKHLVIDKGLCTMCGTCIGICPKRCLSLGYENEEPLPVFEGKCSSCGLCFKACPGIDIPLPELERFCFGKVRENKPNDIGVFSFSGVGCAKDNEIRRAGATGGIATALLIYGLESGLLDCALVAGFSKDKPWRTEAKLATTRQEVLEAAQSKYAVVATNSLLGEAVRLGYKKIGIVGCPCHIEAVRKMEYQALAPKIVSKIKILIGLFCGGNYYFEGTKHAIAELLGVSDLRHVTRLQYRGRKDDGWSSNFIVDLDNGEQKHIPRVNVSQRLHNFARERCELCIDWSCELADISVGDHWESIAKPAEQQSYTNTAFLVRTDRGASWIRGAQEANYIDTKESSTEYFTKYPPFEKRNTAAYLK